MHCKCSAGSRHSVCTWAVSAYSSEQQNIAQVTGKALPFSSSAVLPAGLQTPATSLLLTPPPTVSAQADCDSSAPPTPRTGAAKWGTADGGRKTADLLLPSERSWAARDRNRAPDSAVSAATRGLWHSCSLPQLHTCCVCLPAHPVPCTDIQSPPVNTPYIAAQLCPMHREAQRALRDTESICCP